MALPWLDPDYVAFPSPEKAMRDPNGLLAAGGDLTPQWLLTAYRHGIFPWYEDGQPILWWSPDPRLIIVPGQLHISRSLRKVLRSGQFTVSLDRCFDDVIVACAAPRSESSGTWITAEMQNAYSELHGLGHAHSVEVWDGKQLVGGLYGVAVGKVFFGESMFSRQDNASKVALAYLSKQLLDWEFRLIDCQVSNPHLRSLGAQEIERQEFQAILRQYTAVASRAGPWQLETRLNLEDHEK